MTVILPRSETEAPIKNPAFLIETRSLGGMSGSPVMFHTEPTRRYRREPLWTEPAEPATGLRIASYFLVGMLLGGWYGQNAADFAETEGRILNPTDGDFNTGIAVVLPHTQIVRVIDQDELRTGRVTR